MQQFDVIVVGTGGAGSAALYHVAKRGARVLGLDQFPPGHANGSSHGQSRIIRQAYFEHSDYVPLLLRAYQLWHDLEQQSSSQLFHQAGLLEVGAENGVLIPGVLRSASEHSLNIEALSLADATARFRGIDFPPDLEIVFEPTAGYLLVELCVKTHINMAREENAQWMQTRVLAWEPSEKNVVVTTECGAYAADQLIVCGGAWSGNLLSQLSIPFRVLAKHQYWFASRPQSRTTAGAWPPFFFELPQGCFYGFPPVTDDLVKVARHTGGTPWSAPQPLKHVRDADDAAKVADFVTARLPPLLPMPKAQQACMYTISPDEHFVVGRHPLYERVVFAAGLSGHGFKFSPVLGEALCDLALEGKTSLPIRFLGLDRFQTG